MPSRAWFRSSTGEAWSPFQPRSPNRGRRTTVPVPRSACRMAAAIGIMRSTAGCVAVVGSVLDDWPPCATTTTPVTVWPRRAGRAGEPGRCPGWASPAWWLAPPRGSGLAARHLLSRHRSAAPCTRSPVPGSAWPGYSRRRLARRRRLAHRCRGGVRGDWDLVLAGRVRLSRLGREAAAAPMLKCPGQRHSCGARRPPRGRYPAGAPDPVRPRSARPGGLAPENGIRTR